MKQAYTPIAEVTDDMPIDTGNGIIRFGYIGKQNVAGLPYLNAQIDDVFSKLDSIITLAQEFMKDTSIPLEDRWNVYLKVEDRLPEALYGAEHMDILSESLYDDFYMERYASSSASDIDMRLQENGPENEGFETEDWYENYRRMWPKRDEWREAVLAEGVGRFTNDW